MQHKSIFFVILIQHDFQFFDKRKLKPTTFNARTSF